MFKKSILIATVGLNFLSADGLDLLKSKCASCHMLEKPAPEIIPTLKAPAMEAVMYHIKLEISEKAKIKEFILDYVLNPDAKKSVCESNKVEQYGVMPSLKGSITTQEISQISEYLIEHYPSKLFVEMIHQIQNNDTLNALQNSPFLINKESLPHLTGLLIKNWDKKALGLSQTQKEKLLIIRKETINSIQQIKTKLETLEAEVIEALVDKEPTESVEKKIKEIAELKANATRSHIRCISKTLEVLNEEQLTYLLPFWGM